MFPFVEIIATPLLWFCGAFNVWILLWCICDRFCWLYGGGGVTRLWEFWFRNGRTRNKRENEFSIVGERSSMCDLPESLGLDFLGLSSEALMVMCTSIVNRRNTNSVHDSMDFSCDNPVNDQWIINSWHLTIFSRLQIQCSPESFGCSSNCNSWRSSNSVAAPHNSDAMVAMVALTDDVSDAVHCGDAVHEVA